MKKCIGIVVVALSLTYCRSEYPVVLGRQAYQLPPPPETVWIAPNLFIDQHECTNLEYIEYLGWLSAEYGEASERFQQAVPSFFNDEGKAFARDYRSYVRDEVFDDYPVVGLTYEQAQAFARWKTERVNEHILLERRMLVKDDLNFTFSRYFSPGGPHFRYAGGGPMPLVQYRLPTRQEWEWALAHLGRRNREAADGRDRACRQAEGLDCKGIRTFPARTAKLGEKRACHLRSNVAEWLMGGETAPASASVRPENPTAAAASANLYTGFRLVAMYELRDVDWSDMLFPEKEVPRD